MMEFYSIIVSGLPRSGTSLIMQILKSQNIPIFEDGIRKPDINNVNGYFEVDRVGQKIKTDRGFIDSIKGKSIKVIAPFLDNLPNDLGKYLVLFSSRKFDEIFKSMEKMIGRETKVEERRGLILQQSRSLDMIATRKDFDLVQVNFNKMINDPLNEIQKISKKFDNFDMDKAIACVDICQYNNRI